MKKTFRSISGIITVAAMPLAVCVALALPSLASSAGGTSHTSAAAVGTAPINRCNVIDVAGAGNNPALEGTPIKQVVPFGCM